MEQLSITKLTSDDWERFKSIRLKSLQTDPSAFGYLYEEELLLEEKDWRLKLSGSKNSSTDYYGIEEDGKIVALAGLMLYAPKMFDHLALIVGVYTDPEYRGRGMAGSLIKHLIAVATEIPRITRLKISVNAPQENARKLYKSLGFQEYGHSKHELKLGDQYIDQIEMDMIFWIKIKNTG
ncbi:MAG TPA: GNAT family N-acetyltransferase [Candidatus Binatia bacterium]|nr:GNAT family N-acetyltransferase [Candidatus Binatia bacterium]